MARHLATTRGRRPQRPPTERSTAKANSLFPAPIDPAQLSAASIFTVRIRRAPTPRSRSESYTDVEITPSTALGCPVMLLNFEFLLAFTNSLMGLVWAVPEKCYSGAVASSFFAAEESKRQPRSSLVLRRSFTVAVTTSFYRRAGVFHCRSEDLPPPHKQKWTQPSKTGADDNPAVGVLTAVGSDASPSRDNCRLNRKCPEISELPVSQ